MCLEQDSELLCLNIVPRSCSLHRLSSAVSLPMITITGNQFCTQLNTLRLTTPYTTMTSLNSAHLHHLNGRSRSAPPSSTLRSMNSSHRIAEFRKTGIKEWLPSWEEFVLLHRFSYTDISIMLNHIFLPQRSTIDEVPMLSSLLDGIFC